MAPRIPGAAAPAGEQSAVRALLGRGSIYSVAVAIQVSAGVLVLPVLTRLLAPAELGVVALALAVQAVLGVLAALGLPASVMRTFFQERGLAGARAIVAWTGAGSLILAALALVTIAAWAPAIGGEGQEATLRIAVASAIGMALLAATQSLLRAQDRPAMFVLTVVISTVLAQVLGLGALVVFDEGASSYFGGLTVGILAGALVGVVLVGARPSDARSPGLREALSIGLPLVPHGMAIYVLAAGDRAVIARIEDLGAVGEYQVAYVVGAIGLTLLAAANNAWTPIVFGASPERRWQVLGETAAVLWRLVPLAVGALAIGAPLALGLAAPAEYDPSGLAPVTAIVALAAVPQLIYMGAFLPLYWAGRVGSLAWITPLAAGLNVVLNILLVPALGLEGAALATVASYALMAGLVSLRARGLASVPWPFGVMILGTAASVALAVLGAVLPAEGVWTIVRGVLAAGLLGLAAISLRRLLGSGPRAGPAPET